VVAHPTRRVSTALHIPVPYEEDVQPHHPPFPTPRNFGDPLHIGGWKDSRPSWVLAVPQELDFGLESVVHILLYWEGLNTNMSSTVQALWTTCQIERRWDHSPAKYYKRVSSLAISWRNILPTGNPGRQQGRRSGMLARQPCGHELSDAQVTMSYEDPFQR